MSDYDLHMSRRIRAGALVAAASLGVLSLSLGAQAAPSPVGAAHQGAGADDGGPGVLLRYRGEVAGRVVRDASGRGNHAVVRASANGGIRSIQAQGMSGSGGRPAADRSYLHFGGGTCLRSTGCPNAVLVPRQVADPARGGRGPFGFGARVRLTSAPGSAGLTVIRRGDDSPGQPGWSLHVDDGRASCRWSDGTSTVLVPDDLGREFKLQPGRWYGLRCMRWTDGRVGLTVVDPVTGWRLGVFATSAARLGPIRADGPVLIGGEATSGASDERTHQFHGDLDEVFVLSR